MRRFAPALLVVVLLVVGCGAPPPLTGSDGSGSRTARPPAPSPSPPQGVLKAGNCYGSPLTVNSTKTTGLGPDSITLTVPAGWSDQTGQETGEAAALLRLQAPPSYGSDSAFFRLQVIPGPRPRSSAREQATEDAAGAALFLQTPVNDCVVGGQNASFYSYQDSARNDVYRLLVLHNPTSRYPFLYAVEISSQGPIDDQAAADVRAILGSWTWGPPYTTLTTSFGWTILTGFWEPPIHFGGRARRKTINRSS